jgi:hypothetical protein
MGSETFIEPATRSAVSILFNCGALDPYRWTPKHALANNVLHLLNGRPLSDWGIPRRLDPTRNDYELPAELQARYLGRFLSAGGSVLEVARRGDGLQATLRAGLRQAQFALDFASASTVVLRHVGGGLVGHFRLTPDGVVTALEVSGAPGLDGAFRHQLAPDHGRYQVVTSADAAVSFVLPADWTARWSAARFIAQPVDGARQQLQGGWGEQRLEAVAAAAGATSAAAIAHDETAAGRAWRELVWSEPGADGGVQKQLFYTSTGNEAFWFIVSAPPAQATALVRAVANPLIRGLQLDDAGATTPRCPGAAGSAACVRP